MCDALGVEVVRGGAVRVGDSILLDSGPQFVYGIRSLSRQEAEVMEEGTRVAMTDSGEVYLPLMEEFVLTE